MTRNATMRICASCRAAFERGPRTCPECRQSPLLADRYELCAPLGTGASGMTWRARRASDRLDVAIKERLIVQARSFRELDRVRREADFLEQLSHPRIPRLIEHFVVEDGRHTGFYLVSELCAGKTLTREIEQRRTDYRQALLDLASILDVLHYLHTRSPAVVHGDIKPDNVLRRAADRELVIVDFHAARTFPSAAEVGLTTAIGTPGFMAPEQLCGHTEPATDIHAAACVVLAILTRRPLHTLVDDHHRLRWKDAVLVPREVERLLSRMLAPSPSRRPRDAQALAAEARSLARAVPRRTPRIAIAAMSVEALLIAGSVAYRAAESRSDLAGAIPKTLEALAFRAPPPHAAVTAPVAWRPAIRKSYAPLATVTHDIEMRSACKEQDSCKGVEGGSIAALMRAACTTFTTGSGVPLGGTFDLHMAGATATCTTQRTSSNQCVASCAFGEAKAHDIAEALADEYGPPHSNPDAARDATTDNTFWGWGHPGGWVFALTRGSVGLDQGPPQQGEGAAHLTIRKPC